MSPELKKLVADQIEWLNLQIIKCRGYETGNDRERDIHDALERHLAFWRKIEKP